jgi:DNA-directed RNA polymerase subunit RPC12/RpoP
MMMEFLKCPTCGAKVAIDREDVKRTLQCEQCGGFVAPKSSDWNPYDPPSSSSGQGDGGKTAPLEIPLSVFGKFGLAFRLLGENLLVYAPIILTVWIPGNIAIDQLSSNAPPGQEFFVSFRVSALIQSIFGPISIGALIFAVASRMEGVKVRYFEAMGAGFRSWGWLFAANFVAGILITLGYIALIVPGIILTVRFALIDPVVVLERSTAPRARSTDLTAGSRWPIFGSGLLFYMFFLFCSFAVDFALDMVAESVDWLDLRWAGIATSCAFNLIESVYTMVMVFFYLQARSQELTKQAEPNDDFEFRSKMSEVG